MSFGRWLLVHSFSIFLVSLLILGYIYRQPLKLEQVYSQLLQQSQTLKLTKETATEAPLPENASGSARTESAPDVAATEPPSLELVTTPTISRTTIELNDRLLAARDAYWNKDYPLAVQRYQSLIKEDDSNADYEGELGNIYYSLNDYEKAARHFYAAATILIVQNRRQQARALVSPIRAMDRNLGDQLERDLAQIQRQ